MYITQKDREYDKNILWDAPNPLMNQKPISYYESDDGSGGTCQVLINTATKEKYVSAYAYEKITETSYRDHKASWKTWHR